MALDLRALHWAAGFLALEESFGNERAQVCVKAAQVQREPLERLLALFGGKIYACKKKNPKHQDFFLLAPE